MTEAAVYKKIRAVRSMSMDRHMNNLAWTVSQCATMDVRIVTRDLLSALAFGPVRIEFEFVILLQGTSSE